MKFPCIPALLALLLALPGLAAGAQSAGSGGAQGSAQALYRQARAYMALGDWLSASAALKDALRGSPAHAEAAFALAESYYELGEHGEALRWARRAGELSRACMEAANLQAAALISLGRLDEAGAVLAGILAREPNNREALFSAGELDVALGRPSDALARYRRALGIFPDDRRLLVSLALVSGSVGDMDAALSFISRAMARHPDDCRVFRYAAHISAQAGRLPQAASYAEMALRRNPGCASSRALLGSLRYAAGDFAEAALLASQSIAASRDDMAAWHLRGLSYMRMGLAALDPAERARFGSQAISVLGNALAIDPENEFVRFALGEALISLTQLEDRRRERWASWHFDRAREFRARSLMGEALFEYRRGLRLNPFARDRREYAELLRLQGYPARFVDELELMRHLGMEGPGMGDALEAYGMLLAGAVFREWRVAPAELDGRHWSVAVFAIGDQPGSRHADAGAMAAGMVREILAHDRAIVPMGLELRQPSFAQAFRAAREAGADYFMAVYASEGDREISLRAELFVARTGASAGSFGAHRAGPDRLRNASRGIAGQLGEALPFRGRLVQRRQSQGLIDRGRADGVRVGDVFSIVRRGGAEVAGRGIGLLYPEEYLVGTLTIDRVDEEVASGALSRSGFFDRIEAGDEAILRPAGGIAARPEAAANPELRALLRALR